MLMSVPEVEHEIFLTKFFNDTLAGPANTILKMVGLEKEDVPRPWANAPPLGLLVGLLMELLFTFLRSRLSVDKPGPLQHLAEVIYGFLKNTADEIGIHH